MSVCLPAHQAEQYLAEAIESVLAQSFDDWELVVFDNASTDGTAEVVARYSDPRIRLERSDRFLPIDHSWNQAVALSAGRYVKVLPADDTLLPTCLASQVEILENSPSVALTAGRRDFIDVSGEIVLSGRGLPRMLGEMSGERVVRKVVRSGRNPIGEAGALMFRRADFDVAGGFDASLPYPMDLEFALRLVRGRRFWGLGQTVARFRVRADSLTGKTFADQARQQRELARRLAAVQGSPVRRVDLVRGMALSWLVASERRLLYGFAARRPARRRIRRQHEVRRRDDVRRAA